MEKKKRGVVIFAGETQTPLDHFGARFEHSGEPGKGS